MKLDGMKCPHCGSNNTHALTVESSGLWDDEVYEDEKKLGDEPLLGFSTDNMVYRCKCYGCENHFIAMAILEVKVKKMISRKTIGEVMNLRVGKAEE